jgi:hypothetical protein
MLMPQTAAATVTILAHVLSFSNQQLPVTIIHHPDRYVMPTHIPVLVSNVALDSTTSNGISISIEDVIKIYGRMAGPTCFGRLAPPGSSCQVTSQDIERVFGDGSSRSGGATSTALTLEQFTALLEAANFQWPLKPFGVDKEQSLAKTASMNKSAETRVFMSLLEQEGLYNPRDPTGPLPMSLRPQLNHKLEQQGIDREATKRVFNALQKEVGGGLASPLSIDALLQQLEQQPLDFNRFLDLLGTSSICWPY